MTDLRNVFMCFVLAVFFSACTYRFFPSGCEKPVAGKLQKHTALDTALSENSGLLWLEGYFWTFNDCFITYVIDRTISFNLNGCNY